MKKKDDLAGNNGGVGRKVSTHEYNSKGGNNQTSSNYSSNYQRIKS